MKIAFRVDASTVIGTGHVARCLALARGLSIRGHECVFLSRNHSGNMNGYIADCGYPIYVLKNENVQRLDNDTDNTAYSEWLYCGWEDDATQCIEHLDNTVDLLIVDHYAIDYKWEGAMSKFANVIFCIDDLANRRHFCNILLDQTIINNELSYNYLVPNGTRILIGPKFALLREEFRKWRQSSLKRRENITVEKILISLGGIDENNITKLIMTTIEKIHLDSLKSVDVIVPPGSPNYQSNLTQFSEQNLPINFISGTNEMARLLCECDLAIGAGGSSTLERFCLGVPSIVVPIAENQVNLVTSIFSRNLGYTISSVSGIEVQLFDIMTNLKPNVLKMFSKRSAKLCDGNGVNRVVELIEAFDA